MRGLRAFAAIVGLLLSLVSGIPAAAQWQSVSPSTGSARGNSVVPPDGAGYANASGSIQATLPMSYAPQGLYAAPPPTAPPPSRETLLPPNEVFGRLGYAPLTNDRTGISVYDPLYAQTFVDHNGLWQRVMETEPRRYFLEAEYLAATTRKPKGLVGQQGALSYIDLVGGPLTDEFNLGFFVALVRGQVDNSGVPQARNVEARPGFNYFGAATGDSLDDITGPGLQLRWGFDNPDQSSLAVTFRYIDTEGDYNAEHDLSTRQGRFKEVFEAALASPDFRAFDYRPLSLNQVFEQNLFNLNGLPLDDGTLNQLTPDLPGGGVTAPYDLAFNLNFRSQQIVGAVHWYLQPIFDRGWLRVRPVFGARYMFLREEFSFFGRDSGLYYDNQDFDAPLIPDLKLHSIPDGLDQNGDDIIDNAGTLEGTGQQGGGNQQGGAGGDPCAALQNLVDQLQQQVEDLTQQRDDLADNVQDICDQFGPDSQQCLDAQAALDAVQQQLNQLLILLTQRINDLAQCRAAGLPAIGEGRFIPISDPITSTLKSEAQSHLAGPEVGVSYEFGRPTASFRFVGETRFGVLANIERIKVSGRNIGMTTRPGDFLTPTPENPDPNAFSDTKNVAHVSPLLEQSLSAQGEVFQYVPILRRVPLLRTAKLRVGYTVTLIWKVVNPLESVRWQGNPSQGLFPSVRVERDNWWTQTWSIGVHWDY